MFFWVPDPEVIRMKKFLCLLLAGFLIGTTALAVPQLSENLLNCAKQALSYLSSGEYERLVTLLPFSDVSPSASEWERFAENFSTLDDVQTDCAVAYWDGSFWKLAVPLQAPESGSVETMVLGSEDGSTFIGYRYATWSQIEKEYTSSDYGLWSKEVVDGAPLIVAD